MYGGQSQKTNGHHSFRSHRIALREMTVSTLFHLIKYSLLQCEVQCWCCIWCKMKSVVHRVNIG